MIMRLSLAGIIVGMAFPALADEALPPPNPAIHWQIHSHNFMNIVSDTQDGPRGGSKAFVSGMSMLMAIGDLSPKDRLELHLMVSPDPFMGPGGYPLLLQAGESANGVTGLRDRQHPHDLFMEVSAKLSHRFESGLNLYGKAGLPTDAAFGPTAFMHRASGQYFPTDPISHHWLDSTHVSMGVISVGAESNGLSLETSRFTGREPDQHRFDIERPRFDSASVRLGWQPFDGWTAQLSQAWLKSPEALEPDRNSVRQSLSLEGGSEIASLGQWQTTVALARKRTSDSGHRDWNGAILWENSLKFNDRWTALWRYERVRNDELTTEPVWVSKFELGGLREFVINAKTTLGLGLMHQINGVPFRLKGDYGSLHPTGWIGFFQIRYMNMGM